MLSKRSFLSIYKDNFSFNFLSKLPLFSKIASFFERSLIRKNVKIKKILKERHSNLTERFLGRFFVSSQYFAKTAIITNKDFQLLCIYDCFSGEIINRNVF
jgi:hypothetical protein